MDDMNESNRPAETAPRKRGPKPLRPAEPVGTQLDPELLAERHGQLVTMHDHQHSVVSQYGGGLPWSPEHYEAEIRSEVNRGCEAFHRAGCLLLVAREHTAHGDWMSMLERVGIGQDNAERMMMTARTLGPPNSATSRNLTRAAGNQSKLLELMRMSQEQLDELAEDGETNGLSLDDVQRMTVRELRQAVRDAREDLEAKSERSANLLSQLEETKDQLQRVQRRLPTTDPDQVIEGMNIEIATATLRAKQAFGDLIKQTTAAIEYLQEHGKEDQADDLLQYHLCSAMAASQELAMLLHMADKDWAQPYLAGV